MDTLLQDLRFAVRQLRARPGFTAVAVLTLALGIGPTTAIFSVIDTLMLRPLPYPDADRIVTLWQNNTREGTPRDEVAPANFLDWRERNTAFAVVAAAAPYAYSLITPDGRPEAVFAVQVTEGFFDALGLQPYQGRLFTPEHHKPGSGNFALLTYGLWRQRYGGDPALVGSTLSLDGAPYVVLGVLPPELDLGLLRELPGRERSVWVARQEGTWERRERTSGWWNVIARLKPGVSLDQARADMDRVARGLAVEYPATNTGIGTTVAPLRDHLVSGARPGLLVLLGAVGLVLLIACANVANLLLARGTEREQELAVRSALGAERGRLLRQFLTESVLLGLLGGLLGLSIAFWGVDLIKALAPGEVPRLDAVSVDFRVLAFALAVSLLTAVVFGLAPAAEGSRPDVQSTLKGARASDARGRLRLRAGLIVGEIALALTLLIGAGLLLRSFAAILQVDPGFRKDHVLALQVFAWDRRDSVPERVQFLEETERRIGSLPGVIAVGAVTAGPFTAADIAMRRRLIVQGRPAERAGEQPQIFVNHATPEYFRTMGIPLLRGRAFGQSDRLGAPSVALINESARRRYWPTEDPIGTRVRLGETAPVLEIVGVVGDARLRSLEGEPRPEVYLAQRQTGWGSMTYFVRTRSDPAAVLEAVQREIWAVDPLQDFYQTATLDGLISETLAPRRFSLVLLGAFAVMALLLAAVGIYGVISFVVGRRTHELGIRLALGAAPWEVVGLIVGHGARLALAGVALGLGGALAASRVLASMLFGVAVRDVATFGAAAAALLVVALFASYLPARRAAKVDPMVALRSE
ncbi:MAG: ABC transporter permease [Gemmatimonadales bacterium]